MEISNWEGVDEYALTRHFSVENILMNKQLIRQKYTSSAPTNKFTHETLLTQQLLTCVFIQ